MRGTRALAILLFALAASTVAPAGFSQAAPGAAAPGTAAPAGAGTSPGGTTGQNGARGNNGNGNGNNGTNGRGDNGNNSRNNSRADRDSTDQSDRNRAEVPAGSQDVLTEFQQVVAATTGRNLPIFGSQLFSGVPSTFAPISDVPVSAGYVLGPGDEIHLQLSGQINREFDLTVDNTGAISVPDLGAVHVAGLTYGQLPGYLNGQLGKIYRNFNLDAKLGALRTIQVFVLGYARRPGSYTVSSLSTLLNAVFASGGPLPSGSLRDIQVLRNNRVVTHLDLYDLLLHGDKSKDIPLTSGDVIFIPVVGPEVAITGSVNNPAIFEFRTGDTLKTLIQLAGGETSVAAGATLRVERVFEHSQRSIEDVSAERSAVERLQDGDIVSVTSIIDRFRDAVTLRGNVANPGRYKWHQGMRISDLIPNKEALITRNYWRKRNQLGQIAQDYVNENPTNGEGSLQLKGNAQTRAADNSAQRGTANADPGGNSVADALAGSNSVFGAQNDVVLSAPDINLNYAVIERQSPVNLSTSLIPFDLGRIILNGDPAQNYELQPGDVITIFSKADIRVPTNQQTRYVRLEGEFIASGVYSVLPGETMRGLLKRAGGFTPEAYLYASEFTRESTRRVEQQRLSEYADTLEAQISTVTARNQARAVTQNDQIAATASQADAREAVNRLRRVQPIGRIVLELKPDSRGIDQVPDLVLEDGDRFVVPRIPSNVNVEGQVYSANAFVYAYGERVINYLERAGGPDRQADRKRTFILRADGSVVSKQYANVEKVAIYPGDTIVVPPRIDQRTGLQRVVDYASIVGNLGVGVLAAYLITRR